MTSNILPKAAAAVAILGVATGVNAQTTFNVNATVQNSLTLTNEADMELGDIFAISAASDAYKYVTLSPAGAYNAPAGDSSIMLMTLGGQSAARGSVAIGNTTPFTVTLPASNFSDKATNGTAGSVALAAAQASSDAVEVRVGDPGVARFYLGDFRVGSIVSGASGTNCTTAVCTITPSFGATSVSFGIGATLMTDLGGRTTYQEAAYSGSFEVTASY